MFSLKNNILFLFVLLNFNLQAQCDYTLDNLSHVDCNGASTGDIVITIINSSVTCSWLYPDGSINTSQNISSLYAGAYTLTLLDNSIPVCVDTITVLQTIPISASLEFSNICNEDDSADVKTTIWGGTPPYRYQWFDSNGDTIPGETTQNIDSLAQSTLYTLTITDTNDCTGDLNVSVPIVMAMNPFMSSVGTICKDDYNGSARVFVTKGTPPFQFQWSTDSTIIIEHDSFSVIEPLIPGEYIVNITDAMGCETSDTIDVKSNPSICLTIYKAFSPNDDAVHEFWEIENINLYPEALVLVYDRNGRQVYRRRNYENAEGQAFGGKDQEGRILPSGPYYYIIDLENGDDVFKGALTIVR